MLIYYTFTTQELTRKIAGIHPPRAVVLTVHLKKEKMKKIDSHGNRAMFGLTKNQNRHGDYMGG
jgi:hypothetical protein